MSIVRKIRRSLKREGFVKTVALCFENLRPHKKLDDEPSRFDIAYGISTEGRVELGDLQIDSPSDLFGVGYSPTPPAIFEKILTLMPPPEEYAFVDLGAGKGRVVLMAARRPFRSVTGVEFSHELCAIAETNLAKFKPHTQAREVRIICQDATLFEYPAGPLIVYCYFPFGKQVLVPVLDHLTRRLDETLLVFYNVHFPELFSGFELLHSEGSLCIWRITSSRSAEPKTGSDSIKSRTAD